MPEFETDTLLPPKHGVMTSFAKFAWVVIGFSALALTWGVAKNFGPFIQWRADALVEGARKSMQTKNWEQAVQYLVKAKSLAPENARVTKAIVDLLKLTGTNPAELLQMIQTLSEQGDASPELQILRGQTLLRLGRVSEARHCFERLPVPHKTTSEALELMAGVSYAEGRFPDAREFMQRSIAASPESPARRLKLAMQGVTHPFTSVSQEARKTLWDFAHSKTDLGLQAVAKMASLPDLTTTEGRNLLMILDSFTNKNILALRLEVISALARLQPDQKDVLFVEEVARFRRDHADFITALQSESRSVEELLTDGELKVFIRWLAKERQHQLIQQLVPLKSVQESSELFTCLAWALAEDQQWGRLEDLLADRRPALNPILVSIWLSVTEGRLHPESHKSSQILSGAIAGASKSKDSAMLLAGALAAEQLKEETIALSAYQAIASFDEKAAVSALEQAFAKAELIKDTTSMIETVSKLHALKPENHAYADHLVYLQLVCGCELETAWSETAGYQNQTGSDPSLHELLQALACYRFSDSESMKRHLQQIASADNFSTGQRAAYAGLLSTIGKTSLAFQIAEKIHVGLLLPEELKLLKLAL